MSTPETDEWTPERRREQLREERLGRDAGASGYLEKARAGRGALRWERENRAIFDAVAPSAGDILLDAGCGVGRHTLALAPHVRRAVALDFSSGSLGVLLDEAKRRGLGNVQAVAGDLSSVPLIGGGFTVAVCCEVIQHVSGDEGRLEVLSGLRRLLAPGGRLVLMTLAWNARSRTPREGRWANGAYVVRIAPDEMRDLLRRAGFASSDVRGLLVLPAVAQRWLRFGWPWLEAVATASPLSSRLGSYLLTVARA